VQNPPDLQGTVREDVFRAPGGKIAEAYQPFRLQGRDEGFGDG